MANNHTFYSIPENKLQGTLFFKLEDFEKQKLLNLYEKYNYTYQELRKVIESIIDFKMWEEGSFFNFWQTCEDTWELPSREFKSKFFKQMDLHFEGLKRQETEYTSVPELPKEYTRTKIEKITEYHEKDKIMGMCPVASEKTVCCNLRTLDAVKNCGFGCSYCAIQTMFTGENVFFDKNFSKKLDDIIFEKDRLYHVGTGQSSDALMWGNTNGILKDLFRFAKKWPNVLLEFKTKSKNVKYLLNNDVPSNIFCTWTINPNSVILNEEHLTAKLEERISSARAVASKGIKVGFHFHPMVYFKNWKSEYKAAIDQLLAQFKPEEVAFVSFGTLTFPKPIIKKIRNYDIKTKILQMPMVSNPEGKLTYPPEIKEQLFGWGYECFSPWQDKVFFYLCMEEAQYWRRTFGKVYSSNNEFEKSLLESVSNKLGLSYGDYDFSH